LRHNRITIANFFSKTEVNLSSHLRDTQNIRARNRKPARNKLSDREVGMVVGEAADLEVAPGVEDVEAEDVLCAVVVAAAFEPSIVANLGSDA
jgi:hypothetical protein